MTFNYGGTAQFTETMEKINRGVNYVELLFLSHVFILSGFLSSLLAGINSQLIRECKLSMRGHNCIFVCLQYEYRFHQRYMWGMLQRRVIHGKIKRAYSSSSRPFFYP
jgi:hypothetical protein